MSKKLIYLASFVLVLGLCADVVEAGVAYPAPDAWWTYIYTGDAAAVDLDGSATRFVRALTHLRPDKPLELGPPLRALRWSVRCDSLRFDIAVSFGRRSGVLPATKG